MAVPRRLMQPFAIEISDAVLRDLGERLSRTRWPDEVPGSVWDYGTNLGYLKDLVAYWRDTFDWRAFVKGVKILDAGVDLPGRSG